MTGKRQKNPDRLLFTRGDRVRRLQALPPARQVTPNCPEAVSAEARRMWKRLWQSDLSATITDSDLPALYRWLWWYDEWMETTATIRRLRPLILSAPGERLARAKTRHLNDCEASLQKLEEALGMTPLARMRLGVTSGGQRATRVRALAYDRDKDPRGFLVSGRVSAHEASL